MRHAVGWRIVECRCVTHVQRSVVFLRPGARARCARAQPQERGRGHPARCAGGVHRGVRLGQVVAGVRYRICRSAAALPGFDLAVCAAPDRPGRRAGSGFHRRPAAGGSLAAGARRAECALVGGQRHHHLQFPAHAVFACGQLPAGAGHHLRRRLFAQYPGRCLPHLPWPGADLRCDRGDHGAGSHAEHPRSRGCRLARCLAWPEPARHPHHAGPRCRSAVAQAAEENPRLDPLHRRATGGAGVRRLQPGRGQARAAPQGRAQLHGHLHQCAALCAAHLCHHAERADEKARGAVPGQHAVPAVRRQAAAPRGAVGDLRRPGYRRAVAAAAG